MDDPSSQIFIKMEKDVKIKPVEVRKNERFQRRCFDPYQSKRG